MEGAWSRGARAARASHPGDAAGRLKRPRWLVATVVGVAVFLVVAYASVSAFVAYQLVNPARAAITVDPTSIGSAYESVSFPSRVDHLVLRGWLFHASPSNGRSVIFLNGWKANRVDVPWGEGSIASDMVRHGYDALLFDLRACGESQGDQFTLGHKEQRDLLGAYDFMRSRGYLPASMTIIGGSMGAATEIMASPQLADVGAMVADTSFSDLKPVIDNELPKLSHLPAMFNLGIMLSAQLYIGEDPNLRPVDVVRANRGRAYLFIHATGDTVTPVSQARALRAASQNRNSELLLVDTSGHTQSYHKDPDGYMSTIYRFVDKQLAEA